MPIEPPVQAVLQDTATKLDAISTNIRNTLAANGLPGAAVIDAEKQIDILQRFYAEASNYDRHYSITRSALTTLLITVGLAASKDQFDKFATITNFTVLTSPPCTLINHIVLLKGVAILFFVPLLLFILAVIINLHFQRMTYSCRVIEEKIEGIIGQIVGHPPVTARDPVANWASGYRFRNDLAQVYENVTWPHFDQMARLLLVGVFVFFSYIVLLATYSCNRKWYWSAAILLGPAVTIYVVTRVWNRIKG